VRDILLPIATGLIGLAAGLLAPWIKWIFEKRSTKLNDRRERIKYWRESIEKFNFSESRFGATAAYSSLRPYLSETALGSIEGRTYVVPPEGRESDGPRFILLDEVARIEKQWKLL